MSQKVTMPSAEPPPFAKRAEGQAATAYDRLTVAVGPGPGPVRAYRPTDLPGGTTMTFIDVDGNWLQAWFVLGDGTLVPRA